MARELSMPDVNLSFCSRLPFNALVSMSAGFLVPAIHSVVMVWFKTLTDVVVTNVDVPCAGVELRVLDKPDDRLVVDEEWNWRVSLSYRHSCHPVIKVHLFLIYRYCLVVTV